MSGQIKEAPYGSWKSPITSSFITSENIKDIKEVSLDLTDFGTGSVYWLVRLFEDGMSRGVVYQTNTDIAHKDRIKQQWTPLPFSCQNRVHEYGGGSFFCFAGLVFFTTANNIYRQEQHNHIPDPFTHLDKDATSNKWRFADGTFAHNSIYVVREDHELVESGLNKEPINTIVRFVPANCDVESKNEINEYIMPKCHVIAEGADFYASPKVSPDGKKISWMQWFHPNLPWDATEIWVADLDENGVIIEDSTRKILGDDKTNFSSPRWNRKSELYVMSDTSNWWNIYKVDLEKRSLIQNVYPIDADIGVPHWKFGSESQVFAFDPDSDRVVIVVEKTLVIKDLRNCQIHKLAMGDYDNFHSVWFGRNNYIYSVASSPMKPQTVICYSLDTNQIDVVEESLDLAEIGFCAYLSVPTNLSFPTGQDGKSTASGYFYPPKNQDYHAPADTLPPVLLLAHGGPTGCSNDALSLKVQYFTSKGFAVFDVNYRGSTGFGRKYRDSLFGNWGVMDLEDMVCAAKHLIDQKLVDGNKICIMGGSAGGYLALRASTNPLFKAAVSWYGISDLEMMQNDMHKFEANYDRKLIGGYPEMAQIYKERSPINHLDQICCAVAFFHGLDDKVVHPKQAQTMHEAVKAKGLPTTLVLFKDEGHGFRNRKTIQTCYDGSYVFMCKVLGIEPNIDQSQLEQISIDNLPK